MGHPEKSLKAPVESFAGPLGCSTPFPLNPQEVL